jgi:hypothetical protein
MTASSRRQPEFHGVPANSGFFALRLLVGQPPAYIFFLIRMYSAKGFIGLDLVL